MSFDVSLEDENGTPVLVTRHSEGGTYVLGGTDQAILNITYNYSPFYSKHLDAEHGLRWLDGKKGAECVERLAEAVAQLGTERTSDYWAATAGNAGYALFILHAWAREHPGATFEVW